MGNLFKVFESHKHCIQPLNRNTAIYVEEYDKCFMINASINPSAMWQGHHLLLHGPQSIGGFAVCVVHHLVSAQPSDKTLSVVGAGNGDMGAPGFQQLSVDSGNSQRSRSFESRSQTHTLVSTPSPYLNGKCSNASWTSGDQNSKRRRNHRRAEGHSITVTRFKGKKKRVKISGEQEKKRFVRKRGC